jgi:hypothetical protein
MSNLYLVLMVGCNTKYSVNGLFLPALHALWQIKKRQKIALAGRPSKPPATIVSV